MGHLQVGLPVRGDGVRGGMQGVVGPVRGGGAAVNETAGRAPAETPRRCRPMPSRREAGELWEWTPAQMVAAALAPCPHHPPRGVLPRPLPARRHHPDGSRIRRPPSRERDIDAHFLSVDWSESLFPFFPIRMQKKVFLLELIDYLFQLAWWSTLCVVLDPGRQSACAGVGPAATFFPPPRPLHCIQPASAISMALLSFTL